MQIAWLGKKSPFCGNVTYSREITNALVDRGHQVSFFHFAQEEEEEIAPSSWRECQEVSIPFLIRSQVYTIPTLRSSKVLTQALMELQPDLVHASLTLSPLDFLLPEICAELGLPLVATFHPAFDPKRRNLSSSTQHLTYQLYARSLANYDRVIIFSKTQRDLLVRLGVPANRLEVIPNGVDTDKYSPGTSSFKSEVNAEQLFIYLGRITPEKNVESLLRAWKQSNMNPGCKLLIVGDGILRPSLEPFYGPEHGIIWWGYEPDEQRRIEMLRGSDVFILPSLVEGLSLSLLEAMACGIACVATDAGADGEVLAGDTGVGDAGIILKTQGVSEQLKTLLPLLQGHPEFAAQLGQKARKRVEERYTLNRNIDRVEEVYKQVKQQKQQSNYFSLSLRV